MAQINMKHAVGFLFAGAIGGAAIALLYAPESGVRTRKDIKKFAGKTVDRLDDLQGDVRDQVADGVDEITAFAKDGVTRGKKLGLLGYLKVLQAFDNENKYRENGKIPLERLTRTG